MSDRPDHAILEIRDPDLDVTKIWQRVVEAVEQRRKAGAYGPDPASLGPETLFPGALQAGKPSQLDLDHRALDESLAKMTSQAHLHEFTFLSRIPIVGRLVVVARQAWSWMAARWIGQHIVQQQSAFNQTTVQFNSELVRWQDTSLRRLRHLEEQVRRLEARLEKMEENIYLSQEKQDRDR